MTTSSLTTGEKTALALDGDNLHGISLCLHPNNSSTCAPPPAGDSQVGVRIQSILQTALRNIPVSCQRGVWPSSVTEVLLQRVQRGTSSIPNGSLYPTPLPVRTDPTSELQSFQLPGILTQATTKDDCSNTEHQLKQMRGVT